MYPDYILFKYFEQLFHIPASYCFLTRSLFTLQLGFPYFPLSAWYSILDLYVKLSYAHIPPTTLSALLSLDISASPLEAWAQCRWVRLPPTKGETFPRMLVGSLDFHLGAVYKSILKPRCQEHRSRVPVLSDLAIRFKYTSSVFTRVLFPYTRIGLFYSSVSPECSVCDNC